MKLYISLPTKTKISFIRDDILCMVGGNGIPMVSIKGIGDYAGIKLRDRLKIDFKKEK